MKTGKCYKLFFILSGTPLLNIYQHTTVATPADGVLGVHFHSCISPSASYNEAELPALFPGFRS